MAVQKEMIFFIKLKYEKKESLFSWLLTAPPHESKNIERSLKIWQGGKVTYLSEKSEYLRETSEYLSKKKLMQNMWPKM